LNEDVVDAVIDEIDADRPMQSSLKCHAQLGADTVGAGDEHWIVQVSRVEPKQAAERTDFGEHTGGKGAPSQRANPPHNLVASFDVDAGLLVVHQKSSD